jgi:hypothetical protein
MHRYPFEAVEPRTFTVKRMGPSIRVVYDQARVPDVSAVEEFVTSAVFTVALVFLIILAL